MTLARDELLDRALAVLREIEFGNPAYRDLYPLCGNDSKAGRLAWCRIGLVLSEDEGRESGSERNG